MKKQALAITMVLLSKAMAATPEEVFKDGIIESAGNKTGIIVRKGTIKALIDNVLFLNKVLVGPNIDKSTDAAFNKTLKDIQDAIPLLEDVYLFDIFPVMDWLGQEDRPGNVLVGLSYLQTYPGKCTPEIRLRLEELKQKNNPPIIGVALKKID